MASLTLVVGNKNYSSWSLRPWFLLRHFNVPFTERRIALFTQSTDEQLAPLFSNFKVPVLVDNGLTVWDSLAIMEYASEKYLGGRGWPREERARAVARAVSAEMHSSFTSLRGELPMNCRKKFPRFKLSDAVQQDVQRIKSIWRKCRSEYGAGGDWLFGEFSIADAMFAPVVMRFVSYAVALDEAENKYVQTVVNEPNLLEWLAAAEREKEVIESEEISV